MKAIALLGAGLWLALLVGCTRSTAHLYGTGEEDAAEGEAESEAEAEAESEAESEAEAEAEGDAGGRDDAGDPRRDGGTQPDASQDATPPTEDAPTEDAPPDAPPDMPPDVGPDAGVPPPDAATPDPDATPVEPDAGPDAAFPEPDSGVVIILPDAGPDLGPDAGLDAGQDAGPDLGPDLGRDAGTPDEFPLCPAANWLTNPGFEAPIGETWVDTGPGGTLTRDCAVAWEEACSARLETDGVSGGEVQLRQSSIPTVSGPTEICFFARADREVRVELEVASPASPRFGAIVIGTEWQGVCTARDIGEERELRIVLDNPAIPQTVWFDAVFFGPTSCP